VSDDEALSRLRDRQASQRARIATMLEGQHWDEVADLARDLAKIERQIALSRRAPPAPPEPGRRVFVRG
jgi:hypothetical protein